MIETPPTASAAIPFSASNASDVSVKTFLRLPEIKGLTLTVLKTT